MILNLSKGKKQSGAIECPCCRRDIGTEAELEIYRLNMQTLASEDSPLSKVDERTKIAKEKLQRWCEVVKSMRSDALEYERLRGEVEELEKRIRTQEPALNSQDKELESANHSAVILKGEISELREMLNSSKQWNDSAVKIAGLREQAIQKEEDFRLLTSDKEGRDLRQVTEDIANLEKKKDEYIEKINALNREMTKINDEVSSLAQTATRLETNFRNMQEKYDEELKLEEKKNALSKRNTDLKAELEQVRRNQWLGGS
jgi:chromosome segregation ATPase